MMCSLCKKETKTLYDYKCKSCFNKNKMKSKKKQKELKRKKIRSKINLVICILMIMGGILILIFASIDLGAKPIKRAFQKADISNFCKSEGFYSGRIINDSVFCYDFEGTNTKHFTIDYFKFMSLT